jgi:hypothetical protein
MSFAPFSVVHVNAAYINLTGLSSADVVGRPLGELVHDPLVAAALKTTCNSFSLSTLHRQSIRIKSKSCKSTSSKVKVSAVPIGQSDECVTHYMLELETTNTSIGSPPSFVAPIGSSAFAVMG